MALTNGGDVVDFTDDRVRAAVDVASRDPSARYVVRSGTPIAAWISKGTNQYTVRAAISFEGNPWLITVTFDSSANPRSFTIKMWSAYTLSTFFRVFSYTLALIWLAQAFVFPHFSVKCPDCSTNPLLPVATEKHDTTVFPGGIDDDGFTLPPIVERTWVCPRCGYRKITYVVPEDYRPGRVLPTVGARLNPRETEKMELLFERWRETYKKTARFHSYEEWKQFFDNLKSAEREERQPRAT